MSFDGTEGSTVELETAAGWTENYRDNNQGETQGHFFGKDILEDILAQSQCKGIRIYYGENSGGDKKLILVGAIANENDQIASGDVIADHSVLCPTQCGSSNDLNS